MYAVGIQYRKLGYLLIKDQLNTCFQKMFWLPATTLLIIKIHVQIGEYTV